MSGQSVAMKNGMQVIAPSVDDVKGLYEKIFVVETYRKHGVAVGQGDVVFDVGANIGLFSIWVSDQFKGVRVHAFEPIKPTYQALVQNLARHCAGATAHDVGIGSECAELEFTHYPNMAQVSSGCDHDEKTRRVIRDGIVSSPFKVLPLPMAVIMVLLPGEKRKERFVKFLLDHQLRKVRVKGRIVTLEHIMQEHGIETIDLLKINAQGAEVDILTKTPDHVFGRIRQLIVETHHPRDVVDHLAQGLRARGYQVNVETEALLKNDSIHLIYAKRVAAQSTSRPEDV